VWGKRLPSILPLSSLLMSYLPLILCSSYPHFPPSSFPFPLCYSHLGCHFSFLCSSVPRLFPFFPFLASLPCSPCLLLVCLLFPHTLSSSLLLPLSLVLRISQSLPLILPSPSRSFLLSSSVPPKGSDGNYRKTLKHSGRVVGRSWGKH